jgi:hypothetical protein
MTHWVGVSKCPLSKISRLCAHMQLEEMLSAGPGFVATFALDSCRLHAVQVVEVGFTSAGQSSCEFAHVCGYIALSLCAPVYQPSLVQTRQADISINAARNGKGRVY